MLYDESFYYMTAAERNAVLKYTHAFACKCRACTDLAPISDQRRLMLKDVSYCRLYGWPTVPNFSTKISSYEEAMSRHVKNSMLRNKKHKSKPKLDISAIRQAAKLKWDEGLVTVGLIKFIFFASSTFLIALQIRRHRGTLNEPDEFRWANHFNATYC
jgi:hypothetical protein